MRIPQLVVVAGMLATALLGVGTGVAAAASPAVTFVARVCSSYDDISANRARNDVQESLRDLGANSTYVGGQPVLPAQEQAAQPNCRPLPGWRFTMGTGDDPALSVGRWGSLSGVTGAFPTPPDIVTEESVPLLGRDGRQTGESIAGAVTIELGPQQRELAANTSRLWVQGGTPTDGVLDQQYPDRYGFGALRCSVDNLNGDNVEFVAIPQGASHVFCFAYYVDPGPPAGTFVIRKEVEGPTGLAKQAFRFTGDLSYNPGGVFSLDAAPGAPAEQRFVRAVGQSWTVREDDVPGWTRTAIDCDVPNNDSRAVVDVATGTAVVSVSAGETVVCTYRNRFTPPPVGLTLAKRTIGGFGTFAFDLRGPRKERIAVTTTEEDRIAAAPAEDVPFGRYDFTEDLPAPTSAGRWQLDALSCDGLELDVTGRIALKLSAGTTRICQATNRFIPNGSLTLRKRTIGAPGSASFVIRPAGESSATYEQRTDTAAPGRLVTAAGDDTGQLPLGRYEIVEARAPTTGRGYWALDSVSCNGQPYGSAQGRVEITLSTADPQADCTFTNRFVRGADPGSPATIPSAPGAPDAPDAPATPPGDDPPLGLVAANGPNADLRITKSVTPRRARPGRRLSYRIVVANRGPATAHNVVVSEVVPRAHRRVRLRITRGRCTEGRAYRCRIGSLRPGQRVVLTATAVAGELGRATNRVAVVTSTHETNLRNNRASATVRVSRPTSPAFTG